MIFEVSDKEIKAIDQLKNKPSTDKQNKNQYQ